MGFQRNYDIHFLNMKPESLKTLNDLPVVTQLLSSLLSQILDYCYYNYTPWPLQI